MIPIRKALFALAFGAGALAMGACATTYHDRHRGYHHGYHDRYDKHDRYDRYDRRPRHDRRRYDNRGRRW